MFRGFRLTGGSTLLANGDWIAAVIDQPCIGFRVGMRAFGFGSPSRIPASGAQACRATWRAVLQRPAANHVLSVGKFRLEFQMLHQER